MLLSLCKRPNQLSDKILTLFLGSIIFPLLLSTISAGPTTFQFFLPLLNFLPLSLGPLMYLYTHSLVHENFRLNRRGALHFLPLFLFTVSGAFFSDSRGMAGGAVDEETSVFSIIATLTFIISFLVYAISIQRLLKAHRIKILDCFTHTSSRVTLTWLTWLVLVFFNLFILTHIPILIRNPSLIPGHASIVTWADSIHKIGIFLFVLSLSFFGVQQPAVFPKSEQRDPDEDPDCRGTHGKYETSGLKEGQLQEYLRLVENCMLSKKPYLDGDLTLASLAEQLGMPRHHLTETINSKLGKNFFSYINGYRIHEAMQLLINPQNQQLTILEISHLAGFNSKSSFNTFFKKSTQLSPTQFRKKHLS
jgi:AraC-like DNA-binding protein